MIEIERRALIDFQQIARVHISGLPAPAPRNLYGNAESLGDAEETMRLCWDPDARSSLAVARVPIQTDRMRAQQTIFTLSKQVMAAHGDIITDVVRDETARVGTPVVATVIKYEIRAAMKDEFLHQLHAMNIRRTLSFQASTVLAARSLSWPGSRPRTMLESGNLASAGLG